jgi:hypothetical protein
VPQGRRSLTAARRMSQTPDSTVESETVTQIRVVVHLSQDFGGGHSENHWSIYLLLDGGRSVRMNMTADYGHTTGRLEWFAYDYHLTTSALQYWDYAAAPNLTVKAFYDELILRRRHKYRFSGGGSGCRFWW